MEQFSFDALREMFERRRWLALSLFAALMAIVVVAVFSLPSMYTAGTFFVVEQQQIPEKIVQPTVTTGAESRLQTISQEILSRSRLESLIRDFDLYRDLRKREALDDVIDTMRKDIRVEIKTVDPQRMRADPNAVTLAFRVSYTGSDPHKVTRVANTLASFYVEENLRARERQATGTTQFLAAQVADMRNRLAEQERAIGAFKEQYLLELPQQVDVNLKTIDRLQGEIATLADRRARTVDKRGSIAQQIRDAETAAGPSSMTPDAIAARIEKLDNQLTELRTTYTDKYPEVGRVRREIASLRAELARRASAPAAKKPVAVTPEIARLQKQLADVDADIRSIDADIANDKRDIDVYQRRVENAPKREETLAQLMRDHLATRDEYGSLLKRQEEARLASNMEERQKGEQFRILDPATVPDTPAGPMRWLLLLGGTLLSAALSVGAVVLREKLGNSFHRLDDLRGFSNVPVLVSVPRIVTEGDRTTARRGTRIRAAALALTVLVLTVGTYELTAGNEALVRVVMKPTGGLQLSTGPSLR